tara:strand:- start:268 stop:498 length:231 start_codon:yes stop_codon:yes gene_type:complete
MTKKINEYNEKDVLQLVRNIKGNNDIVEDILDLLNKKQFTNNINYEKAYNVLMDYFDYIPEDEKENLDKQLKELGL